MISPVTCVSMILFAGSGLYLYTAKHQAEVETREIRRLVSEAETIRQRAGRLVEEYQTESDQEVLGKLAARFLPQLRPTQPTQFVSLADLDSRLPPVGLPPPVEAAARDLVYAYPPAPSGAAVIGEEGARLAALSVRPAAGSTDASRSKTVSPARPATPAPSSALPPVGSGATPPATSAGTQMASAVRAAGSGVGAPPIDPSSGVVRSGARVSNVVSTSPPYGSGAYGAPYAPGPYGAASYGAMTYATGGASPSQPVSTGSALGMARTMAPRPYAPPPAMPQLWPGGSGG